MNDRFDADIFGSASLDNALRNLTGPLMAGAAHTELAASAAGRLAITWQVRRPLVLAALKAPLGSESLVVSAVLDPDASRKALPVSTFARYSEAGAMLPLHAPDASGGKAMIAGLTLAISVSRQPETGAAVPPSVAEWQPLIGFRLVEGNFGKLLFVLLQEKARLRRQAREICAMRFLSGARRDALDRIGAGLGVERFQQDIAYDGKRKEIVSVPLKDAPLPEPRGFI